MNNTVVFRDFELRDIDFIYKCKNDVKLNQLTVGQFHPFTYYEAEEWVKGVIRADRKDMRFWAICTNNTEKKIVGWVSLSQIDVTNKSACSHGVVIGDKDFKDGSAWIESSLFLHDYVFEILNFNRLFGSCLEDQISSRCIALAMFEKIEGIAREAVYKNGKYNNVIYTSILRDEYIWHKQKGDYEFKKIIKRMIKAKNEINDKTKILIIN